MLRQKQQYYYKEIVKWDEHFVGIDIVEEGFISIDRQQEPFGYVDRLERSFVITNRGKEILLSLIE